VTLTPHPCGDFTGGLQRAFDLDLGKLKTVDDFIEQFLRRSDFPNSVTILRNGSVLGGKDPLSIIPPDSPLIAQYPAPPADSAYYFMLPERQRERVRGIFDRTVLDLKCHLLEKCGLADHLPNVLKLEFWSLELSDSDVFGSLGLPADSHITASRNEVKSISVVLIDGSKRTFTAGDADRVSVLKIFVSQVMSTPVGNFVFRSSAGDVDETLFISELPDLNLTVVSFMEFQFDSAVGPRSVHLLPTGTVLDGRAALAAQLGQSPDDILLLCADGSPAVDNQPLSSGSFRISFLQEMRFVFNSQSLLISVDFDLPISQIKEVISKQVGIPVVDLDLLSDGATIDDEMTLNDLDVSPSSFIEIACSGGGDIPVPRSTSPSTPRELRVILLLGVIPRGALFQKDATQTLADLLPEVITKWDITDLELEFVAGLAAEENWRILPFTTLIADVPDKDSEESLGVREATSLTVDVMDFNRSTGLFDTTSSFIPAPPSIEIEEKDSEAGTSYKFDLGQRGIRSFSFNDDAKVLDARQRIAKLPTIPSIDHVTLLFAGKALKDQFLLRRLRIGDGTITVSIRDDQAVLLLTAKAYRK
jgi:hypothetical protein